jgi:hypothetical protein
MPAWVAWMRCYPNIFALRKSVVAKIIGQQWFHSGFARVSTPCSSLPAAPPLPAALSLPATHTPLQRNALTVQ